MKRVLTSLFVATLCLAPGLVKSAHAQQNAATETAEHPRIAAAIRELEGAVQYMKAAPHNFGGHKAAAIQAAEAAIRDLGKAMQFRAAQDNRKPH